MTIAAKAMVVSDRSLSAFEGIRAEIDCIKGQPVVRLCRWKKSGSQVKRTGQVFEFAPHRLRLVADIIADVEHALAAPPPEVACKL
jgi:hypothetical protein